MQRSGSRFIIGTLFVVGGVYLLMRSLHVWPFAEFTLWGVLLTVGGLMVCGSGLIERRNGRVFIGSWGFLYGLFLLLRTFGMVSMFPHVHMFAALLSLALSLLMLFLLEPANFGNLISALSVGVLAIWVYFASTNEAWADNLGGFIKIYWPVALILFGVSALMGRKKQSA